MVSISPILFLKLQNDEFEDIEFRDYELTNIKFEVQAWEADRQKGYLQNSRQGVLLALRWGEGNECYVPLCAIKKSGWFNIFSTQSAAGSS